MKLNLKRPIVFFDLETTGLNPVHDRIVEISILKINVNGEEEMKTWLINPECPIPPVTSAVHHIFDADVADRGNFKHYAPEILKFIGFSDIAGYNILKFDIPMLMEEFLRAGIDFDIKTRHLIDVMNIFMKMEPRTLKGAYRFFLNKDLVDAHSASADTSATYEVLMAMLDKYHDTEYTDNKGVTSVPVVNDIQSLSEFSAHNKNADLMGQIIFDDEGKEVFKFGKHKDKRVEDVFRFEPQYYDWIMKSDFPEYTKKVITGIKLRMSGKNIKF
ncbi:MAG: 3'-5' exonuclease [Lentimicrobiaceae bacterium]|nr:3'-5' exonuclease [Lentimicrobiaceae bacterium]